MLWAKGVQATQDSLNFVRPRRKITDGLDVIETLLYQPLTYSSRSITSFSCSIHLSGNAGVIGNRDNAEM